MEDPKATVMADRLSQPSRAILLFARAAGVPHDFKNVELLAGEHRSEEYARKQPFRTVPTLVDGDVVVRDSCAIVRYLSAKYGVAEHWYPRSDLVGQARVDEFLHWQHANLRRGGVQYFQRVFLRPLLAGKEPRGDPALAEELAGDLARSLDQLEGVFLDGGKNRWVAGGEEMSVADLFAASELEQPRAAGLDVAAGRPLLADYLARVRAGLQPHYDEVHEPLRDLAETRRVRLPTKIHLNKI